MPSEFSGRSAILLTAHGSSHPLAQAALEAFALRAGAAHPALPVHLAYTARPHRGSHLGPPPGRSLAATLEELAGAGLSRLLVQSLHVIAGDEWERTARQVARFARREGVEARVGGPLLSQAGDAVAVAEAVAASLPDADGCGPPPGLEPGQAGGNDAQGDRGPSGGPGQPVVLMGHGTTHQAQELYRALARRLEARRLGTLLGVMEAHSPDDPLHIQAIIARLTARGARSARLMPLLTVSGRHAHNDLAGRGPKSWKTLLAQAGIASTPDLAGLVEREAFATLWLGRIARAAAG